MSRRYWFFYNGLDGDEGVIANYSLLTQNPQSVCPRGHHLCAIYVYQELGSSPAIPTSTFLTTNIQTYITDGKASTLPQPTSATKFTYFKS